MHKAIHRFNSPLNCDYPRARTARGCRYKAVFFDLDGTLVDTVPHICESYQLMYRRFGLPVLSDEDCMRGIGLPLFTFVTETVPAELREPFMQAYRRYNEERMTENTAVFWPAMRLLRQLRALGVPMGILTAKGPAAVEVNLKDFALSEFFSVLITNRDTDRHKPDPAPLHLARERMAEQLGTTLEMRELLYVGDARFDVACANRAGCDAALVQWTRMPLEPIREAGRFFVVQVN